MNPTFMSLYRAGAVDAHAIHEYFLKGQRDGKPFGPELWAYLGMTRDEVLQWIVTGELEERGAP